MRSITHRRHFSTSNSLLILAVTVTFPNSRKASDLYGVPFCKRTNAILPSLLPTQQHMPHAQRRTLTTFGGGLLSLRTSLDTCDWSGYSRVCVEGFERIELGLSDRQVFRSPLIEGRLQPACTLNAATSAYLVSTKLPHYPIQHCRAQPAPGPHAPKWRKFVVFLFVVPLLAKNAIHIETPASTPSALPLAPSKTSPPSASTSSPRPARRHG